GDSLAQAAVVMSVSRSRAQSTLRVVFMKCYLVVFPILGQCRAGCYTLRSDSRADHPIPYRAMVVPGLSPGETVENRPLERTFGVGWGDGGRPGDRPSRAGQRYGGNEK